jgi:nicotinate-nucleotide adenylyltransferase
LKSKQRLGIFGGTFDPPHLGHLILAMEAFEQLSLNKILWVLEPIPPHKLGKRLSSVEDRITMLRAAIDNDPMFEASDVDINRPGPHYVIDTMKILHLQFPHAELIFLMGGDSLRGLPDWHEPEGFLKACDRLGVMRRPGEKVDLHDLDKRLPGLSSKVEFIDAPLLEISSKNIRTLVANKKPFRYYLPPDVYAIIREKGLYLDEEGDLDE